MVRIPRAELLELFLQEVESYLPEIRKCLATLRVDRSATAAVEELHRLFHNIKGAASQVQLADLSRGAKTVETIFDHLVEEGHPVSDGLLTALEQTVELLGDFICKESPLPDDEVNLYARIVMLFAEFSGDRGTVELPDSGGNSWRGQAEPQEYRLVIRSLLPLLQELAGYLSMNGRVDTNNDTRVYGRLSQAVVTLAAVARSVGMEQQYQLLEDFHQLLDELRAGAHIGQQEMAGLIQDFLHFLEAVYTYADPKNNIAVGRVKDRFRGLHRLLAMSGVEGLTGDGPPELRELALDEDIFATPLPEDESVLVLDQLTESLFLAEQSEEPELPAALFEAPEEETFFEAEGEREEPLGEEQQLLLEIFQSECEEHLIVINHSLNTLEKEVKQPCPLSPLLRETVSVMRRAVHTLKGAAAMTGVNLMARGAHSLEDLLDWLHDDAMAITPEEVQVIATGIDVLELLSQSPQAGTSIRLDRLVETIGGYLASYGEGTAETTAAAEKPDEVDLDEAEGETGQVTETVFAEQSLPEQELSANLPGESGILRVRLDDLDELQAIEGELVVARGALEKMLEEFSDTLHELDHVKDNLRRKSQELEAGFEVQSLYGFNPRPGDETSGGDLSEFDPIELDRYSQLNLIIRSFNEISVDVNSIYATLASLAGDIGGQIGKQQLTMRVMQDKLMRIRMTPMSSLSRVLFRTVRETAKKLNKKVNLVITGEDVYMDRFVWAKITDPLMHILRNAVDHGVETPEQRVAAGKPEFATIHVEAEQRSRIVIIRISDDGHGIDAERVKAKIRSGGLVENLDALSEKDILEFLFHPSFSTRQDISTISGRGIGLDVVRSNVQELRGTVEIDNKPGQGVSFEFHIPFTLSVNRAVMVAVAGKVFAVPLQDIQQVKRFAQRELEVRDGLFLRAGDDLIPVVNLGFCLQLEPPTRTLPADGEGVLAILFQKADKRYAVSVQEMVEQREIIVKGLGSHLTHVPGISGVTLTGLGELIPILNLPELIEAAKPAVKIKAAPELPRGLTESLKVLIVDDSISVRHSIARLVENQSWQQQQAVDGLDAMAKLETFIPNVIVLDIEMPRMNGYEFKSNLNNNPAFKDIPVIMLTSRVSEKHQQKARELGIMHYMTKPYQEEIFIRLLESIGRGNVT